MQISSAAPGREFETVKGLRDDDPTSKGDHELMVAALESSNVGFDGILVVSGTKYVDIVMMDLFDRVLCEHNTGS
jgi:hypothetical protein